MAPLFVIALIVLITTSIKTQKQTSEAYSKAGAVASEAFSAIRTVAAYSGERHELGRYTKHVLDAARFGVRRGIGIGFSVGIMVASFYLECMRVNPSGVNCGSFYVKTSMDPLQTASLSLPVRVSLRNRVMRMHCVA